MSFKKFLDNYYVEEYLTSEFTFGFELEGFTENKAELTSFIQDFFDQENFGRMQSDSSLDNHVCSTCDGTGEESCSLCDYGKSECIDCEGTGEVDCKKCGGDGASDDDGECEYCHGSGKVKCEQCDGSGTEICPACEGHYKYPCEECGGSGASTGIPNDVVDGDSFEWASPIFKVTPSDLSKVIKLFKELNNKKLFTINSSCGFHVHIGIPTSFQKEHDWFWVLCHLAVGDIENEHGQDALEYFSHFGKWDFFNDNYATYNQIDELRTMLRSDVTELRYEESKYNIFHIHPQGTLEWRGPRGFLKDQAKVKEFFLKMLPELVRYIAKAQHEPDIDTGNGVFTKQEIFNIIEDSVDKNAMSRFVKSNRRDSFKSFAMFSTLLAKRTRDSFKIAGKWLSKAQGDNIRISPLTDNSNVVMLDGKWRGGDFYGLMHGGDWLAPKENFKGLWIQGYIKNQSYDEHEAAKYFGYDLEQRKKRSERIRR